MEQYPSPAARLGDYYDALTGNHVPDGLAREIVLDAARKLHDGTLAVEVSPENQTVS
jgi:hypothetical protein